MKDTQMMSNMANQQNDLRVSEKNERPQEKKVKWDMRFTPEMIEEIEQRHKENPFWMWEKE
jgi:hypothetical protein